MQVVQKIWIELQEMVEGNKIKTGHFWFQGTEYQIEDGKIKEKTNG